jgi:hypothetical protein
MEQIDASIARYLATLDRADREESDLTEAKASRLKEKIAGLTARISPTVRRNPSDAGQPPQSRFPTASTQSGGCRSVAPTRCSGPVRGASVTREIHWSTGLLIWVRACGRDFGHGPLESMVPYARKGRRQSVPSDARVSPIFGD